MPQAPLSASVIAIGVGAACGALLRWVLNLAFAGISSSVPLGTLAANLVGGFLIGVALGYFTSHADVSPLWRLLIITGFLGGLTTFSSFSGEVILLMQQGRMAAAIATMALHVCGSLLLTALGLFAAARWWRGLS